MTNAVLPTSIVKLEKQILGKNDTMIVSKEQFGSYFSPIFAPIAEGYCDVEDLDLGVDNETKQNAII